VQGQNYQPPQEKKANLEKMLETLTANTVVLQAETKSFMAETRTSFKNQSAAIHNLEVQVGNLSAQLANRAQGSMPSDTVKNPKEQVNTVSLRSGKKLQPAESTNRGKTQHEGATGDTKSGEKKLCPHCGSQMAGQPSGRLANRPTVEDTAGEKLRVPVENNEASEKPIYDISVPYPERLKKSEPDISKFMEIFKKLQVNIPFSDMIEQVPRYARYLKDILAKKRKLPHGEQVAMTEQCSAVLTRKLPKKEKDPGNFSLKCEIGKERLRGLCDPGASINLMPLSIFKRLKIGQMRHT
jgi:hypothetical protein